VVRPHRQLRQFFLCELSPNSVELLRELRDNQPARRGKEPERSIEIYPGDFNHTVEDVLSTGCITEQAATFCLLDQRTFECKWSTIEALARHKKKGNKIEIFYFMPEGWLARSIAAQKDRRVISEWWGKEDWSDLRGVRGLDRAILFCQRFKNDFGYAYSHPWPIYEKAVGGGRGMYFMIHSTDHPEAPKLMARAYKHAVGACEPAEQIAIAIEELMASSNQETLSDE